ncbi:SDR family oxidoreductase [Bacteroidales bacterium AH-315-I05]|nr:SDR family oxidoreductase [Bacteroidales bacterium AH-315-I05]
MGKRTIESSKVLVTGGAGFIGSNLCERLLEQNNQVVCLDNFITGKKENVEEFLNHHNFKLIEGDIRNLDDCKRAVQNVEHVLHQAALGSIPRSIDDPLTTNSINITGFLNMLQATKEAGIKRFVYAASSSTYGDSIELPKVEERIGKPLSPYAVSKYVNELYAKVFSDLYGIETIGLRYFNVFGRRQDPEGAYAAAIPKFIKAFIAGKSPVIYGDGTQTRDFTYIENVIQANQLAALTELPQAANQVYNVAYGESSNLNELVQLLKELLIKFDSAIKDIFVEYGTERVGDIKHSLASIEKAKELLEYRPEYNFENGLKEAIKWYWESLKIELAG